MTSLPPCSWIVRRNKARRFIATKNDVTIPLQGIRRQIERNHFPYHIVKRHIPYWISKKRCNERSRMAGLEEGRFFDKEVEDAIRRHKYDHFIFTHLEKYNMYPIAVKVLATNAELNSRCQQASCAEIDVVAFNRATGSFAVVEVKKTSKCMHELLEEEERSPRCRKTKRKRHFLDMARLQAQIGAICLKNTYDLQNVECYLFVVSKSNATNSVNDANLFKLELVDQQDVKWIVGYEQ